MDKVKMSDDDILEILFNKTKTKALLKRVKISHPDKWRRIFGNVSMAYDELREHSIQKSFFSIGVYDPKEHVMWPWHCNYSDGIYLSSKGRLCKLSKAAEFEDIELARNHFHEWSGSSKYKMEIIEIKKLVSVSLDEAIATPNNWQLKKARLTSAQTNVMSTTD